MTLGYDRRLYILAFDHRGSFQKKMFGIQGDPDAEQTRTIADAKHLIYEGMVKAVETSSVAGDQIGVLVDEQFGGDIPREAKGQGLKLAMPVEKSGQNEFDFEYGDAFGEHIEQFAVDFSKVLVRYNPDDDAELNARQLERLKRLADWLHEHDRKFLFELLVPAPTSSSRPSAATPTVTTPSCGPSSCAGRSPRARTSASRSTSGRSRASTSAPTRRCWPSSRAPARAARAWSACSSGGAPATTRSTTGWRVAAPVEGFVGFAIGRSIWWDALKGYLDGGLDRDAAAQQVADKYLRFIRVYEEQQAAVA